MLGETTSRRTAHSLTALLPAVPLNLLIAWPVSRLCRAVLGDRARGRAGCGGRARCLARRTARGARPRDRFLPPDPKVQEPYRLTPGLAVRVGVLGAIALVVFGDSLLPALVAPDPFRPEVPRDGAGQPAAHDQGRGARAARSSIATGGCSSTTRPGRRSSCGSGTCPNRGASARSGELAAVLDVPAVELARNVDAHRGQLTDPILVKTAVHDDQVDYLLEHQADFPGVQIDAHVPAPLPVPVARGAASSATSARSRPGSSKVLARQRYAAGEPRYHAGDTIGQLGVESAFDSLPARPPRSRADPRRLARAPPQRARAPARDDAGQRDPADARHPAAAGGRAGVAGRDQDRRTRMASGLRTAAPMSRSTRATAQCWRSPRTRPTSRRSSWVASTRRRSRRS